VGVGSAGNLGVEPEPKATIQTGFSTEGEDRALVWGRPADVALAPDGTMFVVDDTGGTIWRVTPKSEQAATGSIRPSTSKP
jgi:glucose/arabinose dehydrogenase